MSSSQFLLKSFATISLALSWGLIFPGATLSAGQQCCTVSESESQTTAITDGTHPPQHSIASAVNNVNNYEIPTQGWGWEPPPDQDAPGRRDGAGTRGLCSQVVSLIPLTGVGGTSQAKPTLLYYVNSRLDHQAELVLIDEKQTEQTINLWPKTDQPGIVSLPLPELSDLPPLEVNQYYQWGDLTIHCSKTKNSVNSNSSVDLWESINLADNSDAIMVTGWVKRIALNPDQQQELQVSSIWEKMRIYTQEFLWYDFLATLAELRQSHPTDDNLANQWVTILNSAQLEELA